ncbi:hypothetical protein G5I_02121 [Acromyrmex echinatior]|uniref:Uncharacterized protein n=1 Tax=Acromyrmex echinatior TaxID=103372 RepID=F4W9G9_ACREC|nr:hypothetical protein G5I_02121 [Acromyrmex echinatior]
MGGYRRRSLSNSVHSNVLAGVPDPLRALPPIIATYLSRKLATPLVPDTCHSSQLRRSGIPITARNGSQQYFSSETHSYDRQLGCQDTRVLGIRMSVRVLDHPHCTSIAHPYGPSNGIVGTEPSMSTEMEAESECADGVLCPKTNNNNNNNNNNTNNNNIAVAKKSGSDNG